MRRRRATATVATPGEWQCKTAGSGEWAQHFSNASCMATSDRHVTFARDVDFNTGLHQDKELYNSCTAGMTDIAKQKPKIID